MEKPGMMNGSSDSGYDESAAEYLETIALLQDEIARLECELLAHEETGSSSADADRQLEDPIDSEKPSNLLDLDRLGAELAARDETISLLLDQLRLVEEAESASRLEWEQLTQWVAEVEQRVERQAGTGTEKLGEELEIHRRQAEECRLQLEQERKAWNDHRHGLDQQVHQLQSLLTRADHEGGKASGGAALVVLESENQRLRQLCQDLDETIKSEAQSLREALESSRHELLEVRRERDLVQDERDRERREFEITITSLRSHASRAALAASETSCPETEAEVTREAPAALEADMRIRAFRQHLKEIHSHEAEVRGRNRLGARLSRLWTRTAPT